MCEPLTGATWFKSSYSSESGNNCVEVAMSLPGVVGVRDSVDPTGPALAVAPAAWRGLTDRIKAGHLTL